MILAMPISSDDGDEGEDRDGDRDVDRRVSSVQKQAITTSGKIVSLNHRSWSVGEKACRRDASSRKLAGVVSHAMDASMGLGGIG